jgi:hypothetical protein
VPSPYQGEPIEKWQQITVDLIGRHPLKLEVIRDTAIATWGILWQTRIGEGSTSVLLAEVNAPATVIGYFFERLFARALEQRFPAEWRGGRTKEEKDLVYLPDPTFSVEIKTSGQLGFKVFGNRSYKQDPTDPSLLSKPEKSGYYITANFHERTLMLLRFGWIDHDDWKPQKAATGQAAGLADEVYKYKLVTIAGDYRLHAHVGVLSTVGRKTATLLAAQGINTVSDLLTYNGSNPTVTRLRETALRYSEP